MILVFRREASVEAEDGSAGGELGSTRARPPARSIIAGIDQGTPEVEVTCRIAWLQAHRFTELRRSRRRAAQPTEGVANALCTTAIWETDAPPLLIDRRCQLTPFRERDGDLISNDPIVSQTASPRIRRRPRAVSRARSRADPKRDVRRASSGRSRVIHESDASFRRPAAAQQGPRKAGKARPLRGRTPAATSKYRTAFGTTWATSSSRPRPALTQKSSRERLGPPQQRDRQPTTSEHPPPPQAG